MMKKLFTLILILGMCFMFGCSKDKFSKIKIGESMDRARDVYSATHIDLNAVKVFNDGENFVIVIEENQGISGIAVISSDRKTLHSEKITPINDENIEQFCGKSIEKIEEQYGKIHSDIGSGFYIPAYITDHATIVFFEIENGIVERISSKDIIANTTIELCSKTND